MRFVDLTQNLRHGMRGVEFERKHIMPRDSWNSRILHLYSHAGTHMDAPVHYEAGSGTINDIPLERLLRPAWVVRLPDVQPRALLGIAQLGAVEERHQPGDGLLLHTGWSRHVDNAIMYRDQLPRISQELAQWCVERKVNILGVEPPAVADPHNREEVQLIHQILLSGGVTIVEGLVNLDALVEEVVLFGAFPLKIEGGDGCPCRAFAIEGGTLQ